MSLSLQYVFTFGLALVVYPFAMIQMNSALDQEDLEGFCLWICLASIICGLPFIVMLAEAQQVTLGAG